MNKRFLKHCRKTLGIGFGEWLLVWLSQVPHYAVNHGRPWIQGNRGWHALDERVLRVRKGVEAYTELTIVGYLGVAAPTSPRSSGTCHPVYSVKRVDGVGWHSFQEPCNAPLTKAKVTPAASVRGHSLVKFSVVNCFAADLSWSLMCSLKMGRKETA